MLKKYLINKKLRQERKNRESMKRERKWKTNSKMAHQTIIPLNINTLNTCHEFVKIVFVQWSPGCQMVSHSSAKDRRDLSREVHY